jgi:hypothetical protein
MIVYIHVLKKKRSKSKPSLNKSTFVGYRVSHIKIYCKEKKAPKMTIQIPLVQLITL